MVKHVHGVAFLLAPHVKIVHFEEHMPARLLSMRIEVGGMKLNVLNVYAPCDSTKSESTKNNFYNALNKAKLAIDGNPKYKKIVLGDYNATISSSSKESGAFDGVLGTNNSNRDETNGNGDRMPRWCLKHQMKIVNSLFRSRRILCEIWRNSSTD